MAVACYPGVQAERRRPYPLDTVAAGQLSEGPGREIGWADETVAMSASDSATGVWAKGFEMQAVCSDGAGSPVAV